MSKFIPQNRLDKKIIENVLTLSAEAKAAKMLDHDVINATSGTYYNEDGNIHVFDCVRNGLHESDFNHDLSYSNMIGPIEIRDLVVPHILGDDYKKEYRNFIFSAASTIGGTGALSMAFCNFAEMNTKVLIPDVRWPSYYQIAVNHDLIPTDYTLFNSEGGFNVKGLERKIKELSKTQDKILIVINDPSHNPSGYSMSEDEYIALVEMLNNNSKDVAITLLLDIAYLDFGPNKGKDTRESFKHLQYLSNNVLVLFAWSASKTFGVYGLRCGALVHMTKDEQEANNFIDTAKFYARSTWSNPNHLAVNIVVNTFSNEQSKNIFLNDLYKVSENLFERGNLLIKKLDEYGVPHYPYKGGFFVFVKAYSDKLLKELKNNKIYACPMDKGLRFAVSSINQVEAIQLGETIGIIYQKVCK